MRSTFEISDIVVHDALPVDHIMGLICFATVRIGPFRVDSFQVRRGRDDTHYVQWPERRDAANYPHPYFEIADPMIRPAIHAEVERRVLAKAREEGRIP